MRTQSELVQAIHGAAETFRADTRDEINDIREHGRAIRDGDHSLDRQVDHLRSLASYLVSVVILQHEYIGILFEEVGSVAPDQMPPLLRLVEDRDEQED